MQIHETDIPDVLVVEPTAYEDERGLFYESFNKAEFSRRTGLTVEFVQDNHSRSVENVLRGLHYQVAPKAQGKLIRAVEGTIFDVAVDIRVGSPTFGKWVSRILSAENRLQLWIPPGFAHGFATLTKVAEVLYKATEYYSPEHERSIRWNDTNLAIEWPLKQPPIVSVKDRNAACFAPEGQQAL